MTNENLGGNKTKPLRTAVSIGRRLRRDDRGARNSAAQSSEKHSCGAASAWTRGRSGESSRPNETEGLKTRNAGYLELIADGGRNSECPNCERLLFYRGECAGCGHEIESSEPITDGGIALERQRIVIPEDGTLTVAINGTKHEYDLDECDDLVFEWEEGSQ